MASMSMVPSSGSKNPSGTNVDVDRLPGEMSDMRIRDDKVVDQLLICLWEVVYILCDIAMQKKSYLFDKCDNTCDLL